MKEIVSENILKTNFIAFVIKLQPVQKFKILKSEIPLVYLEPMEKGVNITKYTCLAVVCCSLYNKEHPG